MQGTSFVRYSKCNAASNFLSNSSHNYILVPVYEYDFNDMTNNLRLGDH